MIEDKNIKTNKEKDLTKENKKYKTLIPKVDIVFQSLFGKNNPEITKSFVQAMLGEKIEKIEINEDKELIRSRPNDKLGILDLQLDINNSEKVDVEVQLLNKDNFIKRLLFYLTRLYSDQVKRGDEYDKIKRVVLIAIIDFEIEEMKEINKMESKWKLIETENRKKILTDLIELDIISLKRANEEYNRNKNNIKAQWMLFLDNPESEEVQEIVEKNEDIKEAIVTVKEMSEDEKMQRLADLRWKAIMDEKAIKSLGFKEGKEEGRKKGKIEGINEIKIKIAKKLIAEGKDIKYISDLTELTEEELKKL